jgi:hypothetical protein
MSFPDRKTAVNVMKDAATLEGFKLIASDGLKSDRVRLHGHRSDRNKGENNTAKTSCEFEIIPHRRPGGSHSICNTNRTDHNLSLTE